MVLSEVVPGAWEGSLREVVANGVGVVVRNVVAANGISWVMVMIEYIVSMHGKVGASAGTGVVGETKQTPEDEEVGTKLTKEIVSMTQRRCHNRAIYIVRMTAAIE